MAGDKVDDSEKKRISKLKEVMEKDFHGKQVLLAAALGVQADYLSRQFSGKKGFSSDAARTYERRLGKPKYFLDEEDYLFSTQATLNAPPANNLDDVVRLLDLYNQASDDARKQLLRVAELAEKRDAQSGAVGVNKSQ